MSWENQKGRLFNPQIHPFMSFLSRASTLPERRSTFALREVSCTKRQQTPQLCLCFAGPLEMGAAEGLPIFLPRCLLSCFFLVFKIQNWRVESSRCACWQIHTDELSCPLQCCCKDGLGWFKSISSAKKAKKSDQKIYSPSGKQRMPPQHMSIDISTPSTLLPWFHPLLVLVGTARPPMAIAAMPRLPIGKISDLNIGSPRCHWFTTPRLGELDMFFPSKKWGKSVKSPYNHEKISILENQNWICWKFGSKFSM